MGLRIFHRWRLLEDLNLTNLSEYGFDSVQLGNQYNTQTATTKVSTDIRNVDNHFDDTVGIVPSFQYWADGGDPIACPNYNASASKVGIVARDGWYNNAGSEFYDHFERFVRNVFEAHGSRIKGVRWNHEIGAERFKEGTAWAAYAMANNPQDFQHCASGAGRTAWNRWMRALADEASPRLKRHDAYEGDGNSFAPYDTDEYEPIQRLYVNFVDFQVLVEKRMIEIMADRLRAVDSGLMFVVYTPQQGPDTTYAHSEYTLRLDNVYKSNVVWEISAWHNGQSRTQWDAWASQPKGSQKYMFALQQTDDGDTNEVSGIVDALLDPNLDLAGNPQAHDPWENSIGFWSDWRIPEDEDEDEGRSETSQRAYLNELKDALADD